jgi:prolyl-tRNA synthetase
MRTRLFLRTLEFYWQEGHTAHATSQEAEEETMRMLNIYADFAVNDAAVPVIPGIKTESEKFAGAVRSTTIEAMMGDTRALQAGTSHFLGQNFAKAFDIQFLDDKNEQQFVWTTSWGLSTRFIGAIIMTHGDDQGLVLPPKLAPTQVILIPIYKNDEEKSQVMPVVQQIKDELSQDFRVKLDARDEVTPGFKFNEWELRGVPLRIEVGPKDIAKGTVVFARRDVPGKAGKSFVERSQLKSQVAEALINIQVSMYERALAFRKANTYDAIDYAEMEQIVQKGWAYAWFCEGAACETKIKDGTKATIRCIPLEQPGGEGKCVVCGKTATRKVYIARAY